ncbi:MAG: helix-turn-helix domain-containing protein [Halapricum sp.]
MPRAKLTLTVPDGVWIGDLTRRHPGTTFRVLAALSDESDGGVGLAEVTSDELASVLTEMSEYDDVAQLDLMQREDGEALIQFATTMPLLLFPARDSGIPLEMPFEITDGQAVWEVTAPQNRLSALGDQLDAFDITFTVDYIQQHLTEEPLLTERQRRLVAEAIDAGYYDTPRECSLTDVADRLDIAKSTASETLHRAEEKIVKQYREQLPDSDIP